MELTALWEWLNDNNGGVTALATMVTALVAAAALRRSAVDSRERSRPMMVAEFRLAEHSEDTIDLVVYNAGQSLARDVKVTFDPMPELPSDTTGLLAPYLLLRYAEPIPTLAPGQQLTNVWYFGKPKKADENDEPTPDEVTVNIEYKGPGKWKRYLDRFPLHVDIVRMTTYAIDSESFPGRLESIDKSLKTLAGHGNEVALAARYVRREEIQAAREARRALAAKARQGEADSTAEAADPASAEGATP